MVATPQLQGIPLRLTVLTNTYRLRIRYDLDFVYYRSGTDDTTMWCWHPKYSIGDANPFTSDSPTFALLHTIAEHDREFEKRLESWYDARERELTRYYGYGSKQFLSASSCLNSDYAAKVREEFEKYYTIKDVYLYDHSSLSLRTSPFGCRWDSGCIGFIFMSHDNAKKFLGVSREGSAAIGPTLTANEGDRSSTRLGVSRSGPDLDWLTPAAEAKISAYLDAIIKEYDSSVQGDVYGFELEQLEYASERPVEDVSADNEALPWVPADSCWGFIGKDMDNNGLVHHIGSEFASAVALAADDIDKWFLAIPDQTTK